MSAGNAIRSIFFSDVHLGCKYCHAEALSAFLQQHEPEFVYIVGDFIDGWRLKRAWHWGPAYNRVFHRLLELAMTGTQIRYTPGNHDAFVRRFHQDFGLLEIADEIIHRSADDRYYLVTHGDQFDDVELCAQWLSVLGSIGYDVLIWSNRQINRLRRAVGLEDCAFASTMKRKVKHAVRFISRFEERLAAHARARGCDGVVCGHIHTPTMTRWNEITYCNTGDWVENCSALVEYYDGNMEIVHFASAAIQPVQTVGTGCASTAELKERHARTAC